LFIAGVRLHDSIRNTVTGEGRFARHRRAGPAMMSEDHHPIAVQYAISADGLPGAERIRQWVELVLGERSKTAELAVRIVDEAEITVLNLRYRGKDGPTNVLSFPCEPLPGVPADLLGDVVICAPVVLAEAVAQDKPPEAHWAHMVIHGVLHLLGYDHREAADAEAMESLETRLLHRLGFRDPYQSMEGAEFP
jgi:probable rRNA maturation factor